MFPFNHIGKHRILERNPEVKIPMKKLKEYHIDPEKIPVFEFLSGHIFDGYLTLVDVFYTDVEKE